MCCLKCFGADQDSRADPNCLLCKGKEGVNYQNIAVRQQMFGIQESPQHTLQMRLKLILNHCQAAQYLFSHTIREKDIDMALIS